jgi:O-antigen/teichoic acid export membrane protein
MRLSRLNAAGIDASRAREFLILGLSTALYQAARFGYSLAAAATLDLASFSAWALVVAVMAYAPALLLGVTNGIARELPYLTGAGREPEADQAEAAGWWSTLAAMALLIAAGAAVGLLAPGTIGEAAIPVAIMLAGAIGYHSQQFVLRSRLRFERASAQQALLGFAVLAALVLVLGRGDADLAGVAAPYAVAGMVALLIGPLLHRPRLGPWRGGVARRLAAIGLPIMLAGVVFSFFVTADRWVATLALGPVRAAPYALASLIASAMLIVPTVVSQQVYPRMAIAHGQGAGTDALRAMARRQGVAAAALVAPVALVVAAGTALLVPVLLPPYRAGVPAAVVLCAAFAVLALFTGYGNFLNVIGGQWAYLRVQLIAVTVGIGLMVAGAAALGILGVAVGIAVSYLFYGLLLRSAARSFG